MKTKRICKSTVSMILALIMLVSMCTVAFVNTSAAETDTAQTGAISGGETYYFKPSSNWKTDGARFAAYLFNGSSAAEWYSLYGPNTDGYYYFTVNANMSHKNIIWCRMDPNNSTNSFPCWNQTGDLTPDANTNTFTMTATDWGTNGNWSYYAGDTYYLKGSFNDWGTTNPFINGQVVLELSAGTYEFQVQGNTDDNWYGNSGTINDTTITTSDNGWELTKDAGNCKLVATGGTYTFQLTTTESEKRIVITYTSSGGGGSSGEGSDTPSSGLNVKIDDKYYSIADGTCEVTLTAGTYTLVFYDGTNTYSSGSTITDSTPNWGFYKTTAEKCQLKLTADATLTFTIKSNDGNNIKFDIVNNNSGSSGGDDTTDPDDSIEDPVVSAGTIYFLDNTTDNSLDNKDAKMFVEDIANSKIYEMIETVDYKSGRNLWYADLKDNSDTTGTFKFYRTSVFATEDNLKAGSNDGGSWWGTWTTSARGTNILYIATAAGTGDWSNLKANKPDSINHFTYGVWVDTKGNGNMADAVKWFNKSGTEYHLYLPSYTNLNAVKLYTSFSSASITGGYYTSARSLNKNVANSIRFKEGTTTYNFKVGNTSYTLKVYKSDNASTMLTDTNRDLWTDLISFSESKDWPKGEQISTSDGDAIAGDYKDAIETKGTYTFYDASGTKINVDGKKPDELKKIKGRGNSTFKASMEKYGKYAYNFNLSSEQELIKGATASKKWCLLANNVDHSMMRNTFIYSLADDIGIKYAPETELVDFYNEGNYLGAYILTEKVEYGSGTLMNDMKSLDDYHEKKFPGYEDAIDDGTIYKKEDELTVNGKVYDYKCWTSADGSFEYTDESFKDKNFLLEFELNERYNNELSWFKSNYTNQCVVVKYPEYVTEKEMQWIVGLYAQVEQAVYSGNASLEQLSALIDVDSFAKMYLIQELTLNLDAAATSFYIHNEGDKLVASPVWDYDWSMGSFQNKKYVKFDENATSSVESSPLDEPDQMFAKYKVMNTGKNEGNNYNFQAQLAHNSAFWYEVQKIYTNILVPVLDRYVYNNAEDIDGDGGYTEEDAILSEFLPKFRSSMAMNDARWSGINSYWTAEGWGTKVTSKYSTFTNSASTKDLDSTGNASKYINTVYYLNDWLATRWNYLSNSNKTNHADDDFYLANERYKLKEDIAFTLTTQGQTVTIKPSIKITKNDTVVENKDMTLIVYVNGEVHKTTTMTEQLVLELDGGNYDIHLVAYPTDFPQYYRTSDTKNVTVTKDGEVAKIKVYFKSSDSYRYTPSVTVGENKIQMTKVGDQLYSIDAPDATAQSYHWYEATIDAVWGESLTVNFTNLLKMDATCTVSEVRSLELYFVVDNLNTGQEAIDVSGLEDYQRNMVKSAVNMYVNDPTAVGLATTSFDGGSYIVGDTDVDDNLTIMDATLLQLALAKKTELSDTATKLADFNLDGTTSINDATGVQVYLTQ